MLWAAQVREELVITHFVAFLRGELADSCLVMVLNLRLVRLESLRWWQEGDVLGVAGEKILPTEGTVKESLELIIRDVEP
jgi:hypothetical protein